MLSFWEQKSFTKFDYIIVGAGISGLSLACELKEKKPTATVLVLERGLLPSGASTKNAGFACIGTLSEKVYDMSLMGKDALLKLVQQRWEGLQILRNRLGDDNIDYQQHGGYELILKDGAKHHLHKIDEINQLFRPIFNQDVFTINNSLIHEFGFSKTHVAHLIKNPLEGQIDTGKMMNSLWNYAMSLGVKIITGAEVKDISAEPNQVVITTCNHLSNIIFKADKVAVCTNAFAHKLINKVSVKPGRGQVICTSPISGLQFKGTFNFDEGFYYFRNFNDRIIFGGGRNLDFEGETTTEFGSNQTILNKLKELLTDVIMPGKSFTIEHSWSGIMAFGENKLPLISWVEPNVLFAGRLNGMGVALGSLIAKDAATLILE